METSALCLMALLILFFLATMYALYRGRDVKATMKVWFAQFSFETTEQSHSIDKDSGQSRLRLDAGLPDRRCHCHRSDPYGHAAEHEGLARPRQQGHRRLLAELHSQ